ncbi:MAG: choice-of-anchor J domain-containing protein [Prevotellaceae bacterium]|jgi:hypothetical protein|nr:choice-of-anchor J domain-containing protein [Prevotellaceae bacterium]
MKNLPYTYILTVALLGLLFSACVKAEWDAEPRPELWTSDRYVSSLNMDFTKESLVDGQQLALPDGWLNVGAHGTHRAFQTAVIGNYYVGSTSDSMQCAAATAYLCMGDAEAWMVTPPVKVAGAADARFYYSLMTGYSGAATFQLLCYSAKSADTGRPPLDASSWTVIADYTNAVNTYKYDFIPLQQNLATYLNADDDVMYLAFRYVQNYQGPGVSSNTWYVDDIRYNSN